MSGIGMPGKINAFGQRFFGGVIDEEQFPILCRQSLCLKRIEHAAQVVLSRVVRANDDGNCRHELYLSFRMARRISIHISRTSKMEISSGKAPDLYLTKSMSLFTA